ncbi:hypothetical protein M0534_09725 [Methylonatrum kenyense]|uniref:hypothetical protein n=1 Tax=Methylonatrum kenyense TaxID=455253 RepID=UPI0020BFEECB|nr:hypothetical protein [Methylonatrum kenyense]MCK8516600.1 hypothetical protein [Methylonatrum kenyense]
MRLLACISLLLVVVGSALAETESRQQVIGLGWEAQLEDAPVPAILEGPRPYGLFVGDSFELVVRLKLEDGLTLEPGSIPTARNFAGGLERQRVRVETKRTDGEREAVLRIQYQIFAAPVDVQLHDVPGFTLVLSGDGMRVETAVPGWRFALSPLIGEAIDRTPGEGRMLPGVAPEPRDAAPALLGFALCTAGGAGLAFFVWGWPLLRDGRQRNAFAQARHDIRQLRRTDGQDLAVRAVRRVHRALDETAGETLMLRRLPAFIQSRPWLQPAEATLREFFATSASAFYREGATVESVDLDELEQLLRQCDRLERRQ